MNWYVRARGKVTVGYVGAGEVLCSREELVKTEFYNEFLRKFNWLHSGAAVVECTGSAMAVATFVRGPDLGPFEDTELNILRDLVPHIRRALMLHRRMLELHASNELAQWGLDQVPFGVILLASDGKVICVNRIAKEFCTSGTLSPTSDTVHLRNVAYDRRLQTLIRTCRSPRLSQHAGGAFQIYGENSTPLVVSVTPIRHPAVSEQNAVALFLTAPEHRLAPTAHFLNAAFHLTPAEIRLAELMAEGISAKQAAEQLQLSRETVKSQLSSIFAKTGVQRQAKLAKLLNTLPTSFRIDS
jgi:DNA-binding CsgD family transcriptional regulator